MIRTLMAGFWAAVLAWATEQPTTLRIRMYNLAGVSLSDLSGAKEQAGLILADAGVKIEWEDGDPDADEAHEVDVSASSRDNTQGAWKRTGLITARILPRGPKSRSRATLGLALPFASRGVHVTLFADTIEQVVRDMRLSPGKVLGAAMAHEVGHILLNSSEHSTKGVMSERWNDKEYRAIAVGKLQFLTGEGERMRATLITTSR